MSTIMQELQALSDAASSKTDDLVISPDQADRFSRHVRAQRLVHDEVEEQPQWYWFRQHRVFVKGSRR